MLADETDVSESSESESDAIAAAAEEAAQQVNLVNLTEQEIYEKLSGKRCVDADDLDVMDHMEDRG